MSFDSQENKALIWGVLSEQKVFENIPDSLFMKVQTLFETEIKSIKERSQGRNADLLIMNKMLMQNFTRSISLLKDNKSVKSKNIEKDFLKAKTELDKFLVGDKPQEIDFSDPKDDEPLKIEDLDDKLNLIINERKNLVSEYEKVDIQKSVDNLEESNIQINDKSVDLKSLDNSLLLKEEIINDDNLEETFLSKLKKSDEISLESINNKLDKLLEKIDILLEK
jgi:hypothetical protein